MRVKIRNCDVRHIETVVPSKVINNNDLDFDGKLIKKIIKNTGVIYRHVLDENESLDELYLSVIKKTMTKLNWDTNSIDGIVVLSQTHEYKLPATSALLHGKLGLSKETFAYDINLGCSGFIYGLYSMMSNLSAGNGAIKRVLLVVGDAISTLVNKKNKSTAFLFGDAASCTALEYNERAKPIPFILKTDGSEFESIIVEDGGLKNKISDSSFENYEDENGAINSNESLKMDGIKVFNFTINNIPTLINESLEFANIEKNDITKYCFHQANKYMLNFLSSKLEIKDKTPINIEKFGNTSCASIPLLITDLKISSPNIMLVGFGVGMSMATCILDLNKTSLGHGVKSK